LCLLVSLGSDDAAYSDADGNRFGPARKRTGLPRGANPLPMVLAVAPVVALARSGRLETMRNQLAHLSEEALVALVARGDQSALAALYDRVGRTAFGLALRVLRDDRLAEDAVQEAFLTVWRTAAAYSAERSKATTWILTLVHRRAVDLVRREQRRRAEPLDDSEGSEEAMSPSAEDAAWLVFERERVQSALRRLPDTQREALELAYYGGFTQSELAERLGQPLGTIKSRMFAGLTRLRELLDDSTNEGTWNPEFTT
jgi:RNA polymerase sigma factor (sigma-70 family)